MEGIARYDVNEEWAHSGMIRAGDFCFLNYCRRADKRRVRRDGTSPGSGWAYVGKRGSDGLPVPRCMEYPGDGKSDKRAV